MWVRRLCVALSFNVYTTVTQEGCKLLRLVKRLDILKRKMAT